MSFTYEDRLSDSPFVETIWRTQTEQDGSYLAVADGRWDILISRQGGETSVMLCGAASKVATVPYTAGAECLGIRFKLGAFMPFLPGNCLRDSAQILPIATSKSFWFQDAMLQLPDYENIEAFVERLARQGLLARDEIVEAALLDQTHDITLRSVQRRFLRATGLPHRYLRYIERTQHAAALLQQGTSILDTVFEAGFADQPHLTKSLKRLFGQTPAQIARLSSME